MSFLGRASSKQHAHPFSVADLELPPLEIEPLREEPASPMPLREEPASSMPLREEPASPMLLREEPAALLETEAELQLQLEHISAKIHRLMSPGKIVQTKLDSRRPTEGD